MCHTDELMVSEQKNTQSLMTESATFKHSACVRSVDLIYNYDHVSNKSVIAVPQRSLRVSI